MTIIEMVISGLDDQKELCKFVSGGEIPLKTLNKWI
jgi:hypothetical protein